MNSQKKPQQGHGFQAAMTGDRFTANVTCNASSVNPGGSGRSSKLPFEALGLSGPADPPYDRCGSKQTNPGGGTHGKDQACFSAFGGGVAHGGVRWWLEQRRFDDANTEPGFDCHQPARRAEL